MMKKTAIVVMVLLSMCFVACTGSTKKSEYIRPDGVEIICFHGAQRCATCRAIESGAQVVAEQFADEIKDGKLRFRVIDITGSVGEKLAARYEVAWSSIVVSRWNDGKEEFENLTECAFQTARIFPDVFRSELKTKIENLLK